MVVAPRRPGKAQEYREPGRYRIHPGWVRRARRIDALPPQVAVKDLGADVDDVLASNSLSDPDRVALRDRGVIELSDGGYDFPPHSITLLSFSLRRDPVGGLLLTFPRPEHQSTASRASYAFIVGGSTRAGPDSGRDLPDGNR
jgi:hypothetical protein